MALQKEGGIDTDVTIRVLKVLLLAVFHELYTVQVVFFHGNQISRFSSKLVVFNFHDPEF
jgi:hypothetical protein